MERINDAYFFDKEYQKWFLSARYMRAFRDNTSAVCGDSQTMAAAAFMPFEYGRDKVEVSVWQAEVHSGMVAYCEAILSHIRPTTTNLQVYRSCGLEAALNRASFELLKPQSYTQIEMPVLVITHLEVHEQYRHLHIASSILEFLINTLRPQMVLCSVEPFYKLKFQNQKTVVRPPLSQLNPFFFKNNFRKIYASPIKIGSTDDKIILYAQEVK